MAVSRVMKKMYRYTKRTRRNTQESISPLLLLPRGRTHTLYLTMNVIRYLDEILTVVSMFQVILLALH